MNEHVIGHAAIETQSSTHAVQTSVVLAIIFHRLLAGMTVPATPWSVDGHCVALLKALHAFSNFTDPTGILMPQRKLVGQTEIFFH